VLAVLAVGLPTYSAFLVLTRAFYAVGETRVPALVNAFAVATSSVVGVALFLTVDDSWRVPGLAVGHTVGFAIGSLVLARFLSARIGGTGSTQLRSTTIRSLGMAGVAGAAMAAVAASPWPGGDAPVATVLLATVAGGALYVGLAARLGAPELPRLMAALRGR
jgi:putative peptidoglycan lipid II flippase